MLEPVTKRETNLGLMEKLAKEFSIRIRVAAGRLKFLFICLFF